MLDVRSSVEHLTEKCLFASRQTMITQLLSSKLVHYTYNLMRKRVPALEEDRAVYKDIETVKSLIQKREFSKLEG